MVHLVHLLENDLFDMLNEVASVVIYASKYVIIFKILKSIIFTMYFRLQSNNRIRFRKVIRGFWSMPLDIAFLYFEMLQSCG